MFNMAGHQYIYKLKLSHTELASIGMQVLFFVIETIFTKCKVVIAYYTMRMQYTL